MRRREEKKLGQIMDKGRKKLQSLRAIGEYDENTYNLGDIGRTQSKHSPMW